MNSAPNLAYHVELAARATSDLRAIFGLIRAAHSAQANAWFNGLVARIGSLAHLPARGIEIAEQPALRHVLHGRKPHFYRVIYAIDDDQRVVRVLHIRHGARQRTRLTQKGLGRA